MDESVQPQTTSSSALVFTERLIPVLHINWKLTEGFSRLDLDQGGSTNHSCIDETKSTSPEKVSSSNALQVPNGGAKDGGSRSGVGNITRKGSFKKLTLTPPAVSTLPPAIQGLQSALTTKDGESFPLHKEDLAIVKEIGRGAYGVVEKCLHRPSDVLVAVKRILLTMDETERRRLMMDLEINRQVRSCPEACYFYGAFFQDGHIFICMEIMDASMDKFYKKAFEKGLMVPENYLVHIAISVVNGLDFLYSQLKVMHRDVKPSNILIDKDARVKVCDFGVSAVLVNSLALTNIGCKPYMAPERLNLDNVDKGFNVKSDVWSLGISLVEMGDGIFPYDQQGWKTPFDQMKQVFERPAPNFTNSNYSDDIRQWMTLLLNKDLAERSCYITIMKHPYIEMQKRLLSGAYVRKSLKAWITDVVDSLS